MAGKLVPALLTAAVALASVAPTFAQTGPGGATPANPNPFAVPAPAANGMLSEEAIAAYLRTLAPNARVSRLPNGGNEYELKFLRDGWNYHIKAQVVQGCVWLLCHLGNPIHEAQAPPANLLLQLLQVNDRIGPTYFSYEKFSAGLVLCLNRPVTRQMSAERFKGEVEEFLKTIKDSYPAWSAVLNATK
jgi:hypothetical protein